MTVEQAATTLEAAFVCGQDESNVEVECACGADLMSDVMAFVKDRVVLLTGLINPQVIRTAELMDIKVVVFVRGKHPSADMVDMAREHGLILLTTKLSMFVACGRLYAAGLRQGGTRRI
jgi:hypothetical protein